MNVSSFAYPGKDRHTESIIVHLFRDATENKTYQQFVDQLLSASERLQQDNGRQVVTASRAEPQTGDLTARDWQVLELMAQGLGTNHMAGTLIISPSAVRDHVQNVLDKLGVHSRLEVIAYAYQHGLVDSSAS